MRVLRCVLTCGLVALLGFSLMVLRPPVAFAASQQTLSGVVRGEDGSAIAGALVQLRDDNGSVLADLTTGADGAYAFDVAYGSYQLLPSKVGLVCENPQYMYVNGTNGTTVDLWLNHPQLSGRLTVNGQPVSEGDISLWMYNEYSHDWYQVSRWGHVQTANGEWAAEVPWAGTYRIGFDGGDTQTGKWVHVAKTGSLVYCKPKYIGPSGGFDDATEFRIDPSSALTGCDLDLDAGTASVSGTAIMSDGLDPAPTVIDLLVRTVDGDYELVAWTPVSDDGTWSQTGLPAGKYLACAETFTIGASAFPAVYYGDVTAPEEAETIILDSAQERSDVDISIPDSLAEPLARDAFEPDDDAAQAVRDDVDAVPGLHTLYPRGDSDWLEFWAVAGHTYEIAVGPNPEYPLWSPFSSPWWRLFDASGDPLSEMTKPTFGNPLWAARKSGFVSLCISDESDALGLPAALGAYSVSIQDLGGPGALSIRGTVTDDTGLPVPGASVTALGDGMELYQAFSDAGGVYEFRDLPGRVWMLTARAPGYDTSTAGGWAGGASSVDMSIRLHRPASPTPGWFAGTVSSLSGVVPGVTVAVTGGPDSVDLTYTTDADGWWSSEDLSAGEYDVTFTAPGYETVTYEGVVLTEQGDVVAPTVLRTRLSFASASITGRVLGPDQLPKANCTVEVTGVSTASGQPVSVSTATDAGGLWRCEGLPWGDYSVSASTAGLSAQCTGIVLDESHGIVEPVFVELQLKVVPGTLSGTVRAGGVAAAGTNIAISGGPSTTAAADGRYSLTGLAPGTYDVTFSRAGYADVVVSVVISSAATTTRDVSLSRIPSPVVKSAMAIYRTPSKSSVSYRRKRGIAKFTLTARFVDSNGTIFAGERVYLQSSTNGKKWKNVGSYAIGSPGIVSKSFRVKKKGITYYRWHIADTGVHYEAYSGKQKVAVK